MRNSWDHDGVAGDGMGQVHYGRQEEQAEAAAMPQYMPERRKKRNVFSRLYDWVLEAESASEQQGNAFLYETQAQQDQPFAYRQSDENNALQIQSEHVKKALQDWKAATVYFENVSDPALIDYAAYDMEAARRKYVYLLNAAKEMRHYR